MSRICIIGQGFVGLTLSVAFAENGHEVVGVDKSEDLVNTLMLGEPPFFDEGLDEALKSCLRRGNLIFAYLNQSFSKKFDFIIITIGTPLEENQQTSIAPILSSVDYLKDIIIPDGTIILRSTVPIGTTRRMKEAISAFLPDVEVGFCPERTVEGKALKEIYELPQIISSDSSTRIVKIRELFSSISKEVVEVSNLETAEYIKLISNIWRDYTFAFSNALIVENNIPDIRVLEAIRLANYNYPRNKIPMPGAVGGPCLSKDSYIYGQSLHRSNTLASIARNVNEKFPHEIISNLKELFLNLESVGILGWAFKGEPPTTDLRNSPTFDYANSISLYNPSIRILGWDPEKIDISNADKKIEWQNTVSEVTNATKVVVIANNHKYFSEPGFLQVLKDARHIEYILDIWNILPEMDSIEIKVINLENLKWQII